MQFDFESGWITQASHCPSPNFNTRPEAEISLLVVHNISLPPGQFGTGKVLEFFQNCLDPDEHPYFAGIAQMCVSAHFFIDRLGELTQFVSCADRAWHAGLSSFEGRQNCNDFSIGVELEGADDVPYTEAQYRRLAQLAGTLIGHYADLNPARITGHSDIAPGRKTDPGPAFDWDYFHSLLAQEQGGGL